MYEVNTQNIIVNQPEGTCFINTITYKSVNIFTSVTGDRGRPVAAWISTGCTK